MTIRDINDCFIEVTNLEEAIKQAQRFKDFHHTPAQKCDEIRQEYWRDMHYKLLKLKHRHHKCIIKKDGI